MLDRFYFVRAWLMLFVVAIMLVCLVPLVTLLYAIYPPNIRSIPRFFEVWKGILLFIPLMAICAIKEIYRPEFDIPPYLLLSAKQRRRYRR